MDWLSVALLFLIGTISSVFLFFKKRYSYWKERGVPFAKPTFPFGNFTPGKAIHFKDLTGKIYNQKDGSPFVGAYFFASPIAIATELDFVQNVLIKDFSTFHDRGVYHNEADDPLSAQMFSLSGEKWKSLRAKLSPTFTSGKMKFMFSTVAEVADRFNATLANLVKPSAVLEMKDLSARFTTDVIGCCAFGIECNSLGTPDSEFRRYGTRVVSDFPIPPLLFLSSTYPDLARKLHLKLFSKDVNDFFMNTVQETVTYREKNNVRRNDFMDLLIQLKNNELEDEHSRKLGSLTFKEIAAQAFVFFFAGFETSSTTMMFALYELALNSRIQEKAREEIEQVLSKHDGKMTYESIQEMVYIDQIISETLRKYPPAINLVRKATKDYDVPNSNFVIEKGTRVFIPVFSIHHDPAIYENPEVFDPSRFSPDQVKSRHPVAFLSFGDGPRNCVGLRFGKMQARIGLVTLLKNYRFKPCEKTTIPMQFVDGIPILAPKYGMYLTVEKV